MKVALVHDWITGMRGGERCLEAFVRMYPEADIFTLIHVPGATSPLIDARVKATSFLNRIPGIRRIYRALLPLFPLAIRSLDLSGYDLVISLSHAAAKNARVPAGVPHICYCFTPMRYIWDQASAYFRGPVMFFLQPVLFYLRWWDTRGAKGVSEFVGISSFVAARIRKFYGRRASVIAPPVRMETEINRDLSVEERHFFEAHPEPFFLCAGALVPYKRIDVAVRAFNELGLPLWIAGKGPELDALKGQAGDSIRFLGHVSEGFLWECYRRCRALVFPGIEDFGIVPIECLASGRPVIAIQAGGVAESVPGVVTGEKWDANRRGSWQGVFVPKSGFGSHVALREGVEFFIEQENQFEPAAAKEHALIFSYEMFFASWRRFAEQLKIYPGVESPVSGPSPSLQTSSQERRALC
jgi:glycosyltransferase involved in cell wall biosynthesis